MNTTTEVAEKWARAMDAVRDAHAAELRRHIGRICSAFRVFGPSSDATAEAIKDAATHIGRGKLAPETDSA